MSEKHIVNFSGTDLLELGFNIEISFIQVITPASAEMIMKECIVKDASITVHHYLVTMMVSASIELPHFHAHVKCLLLAADVKQESKNVSLNPALTTQHV